MKEGVIQGGGGGVIKGCEEGVIQGCVWSGVDLRM